MIIFAQTSNKWVPVFAALLGAAITGALALLQRLLETKDRAAEREHAVTLQRAQWDREDEVALREPAAAEADRAEQARSQARAAVVKALVKATAAVTELGVDPAARRAVREAAESVAAAAAVSSGDLLGMLEILDGYLVEDSPDRRQISMAIASVRRELEVRSPAG
jgi:hypothetical protein